MDTESLAAGSDGVIGHLRLVLKTGMCEVYCLYATGLSHVLFAYSDNVNIRTGNEILRAVLHI